MEIPTWLGTHFLSEVLQEGNGEKPEVINFTVKPAVPPGNNYLSQVFRVKVEYKQKEDLLRTVSLIVKAPNFMIFPPKEENDDTERPHKGVSKEPPPADEFFKKEPRVFAELLPKMHKKVNYKFSPKFYPCSINGGLVLEDLREDGYVMCDRFKQLDYDHCKEVLTCLAKFHAITVSCHNDNPSLVKSLGHDMDHSRNEKMDQTMKSGMEYAARKVAELTKETHKEFSDLLLRKVDHLWETSKKRFEPQEGKLNVFSHGDLWTTNVMFKYGANGEIDRVKLIDYQLMSYSSPASDVAFFIWTSGNNDVRENQQKSLYKIYLQNLNKTLEEIGCEERLSEEEFHEHLKEMADVVLSVLCHVLPIFMADPEDGPIKLEELNPDDPDNVMLKKLYNGKYYRHLLPFIARQYLSWHSSLYSPSYF